MAKRAALLLAPLVFATGGCANLPDIAAGTCGNGVVEPPEDCDTFAPSATAVCLPRGAIGECHLDCRRKPDGSRPSCPTGWGCDQQGICHAPTGAFEPLAETSAGGASSLMAGDFDGDGRAEVVSLEPLDASARTKLRFHYFDPTGAVVATRVFPKLVASPLIGDLSGDRRSDVVFTDSGFTIGVLLGQADRSWVPETFNSFHFPNATIRMLPVYSDRIQDDTALVGLTTVGGVPGLYVPDANGLLRSRGDVPGPPEMLVGDPASGDIIVDKVSSPCWELAMAAREATAFWLVDTCVRSDAASPIVWRDQFQEREIALEPPAAIDGAPQITDMDGDGHLDVLLGAGGQAYVATGDGHGLSVATPYLLRLPNSAGELVDVPIPMPLAAGDFTGDGIVDFVFPDHLLVSGPSPSGSPPNYSAVHANQGAPWTVAKIADLNGNRKVDVVAASSGRLGIDFFNGTGTENLTAFSVPTDGPVELAAVGDFDGDLVDDLAFVEPAASNLGRDSLMIAFGNTQGPPSIPLPVARVSHAEALSVVSQQGIGNLIVMSTQTIAGQPTGVLALLAGNGDRLPYAPYQLVTITSEGAVVNGAALALAAGAFEAPGASDVLALAAEQMSPTSDLSWRFWLLPALETMASAAMPVGGELDSRLRPGYVDRFHLAVNLVGAAADLDGDGLAEAVWAMPADGDAHCGLAIVGRARGDGLSTTTTQMVTRQTLVLDQPCPGAQLLPVDADGDGAVDIALLTGGPGSPGRSLLVLWNDGAGAFSISNASVVNNPADSPEAFALLPATPDRRLSFAYVTRRVAALVTTAATPRVFSVPRTLVALQQGTGIVAADVDGDGVLDLTVAASGNLLVLRAALKTP